MRILRRFSCACRHTYGWVLCASVLFVIPFISAGSCPLLIVASSVVFTYGAVNYPVRFIQGCAGSLVMHVPFMGSLLACMHNLELPVSYTLVLYAGSAVCLSGAFFSGFVCELLYWVTRIAIMSSYAVRCLWWTLASCMIVMYNCYVLLWPLGTREGCFLYDPFLVFVADDFLRYCINTVGVFKARLLFILICYVCALVCCIMRFKKTIISACIVQLLFFLVNALLFRYDNSWAYDRTIVVYPFVYARDTVPVHTAHHIADTFSMIKNVLPHVSCICMPENSIADPYFFHDHRVCALLKESCRRMQITFICGALRAHSCQIFNSVIMCTPEALHSHDKIMCVPFTEWIPPAIKKIGILISGSFLSDPVRAGESCVRPRWNIAGEYYVPYICSDFFYASKFACTGATVLALCSDRWVVWDYVSFLMAQAVRLKAMTHYISVLYIAYRRSGFINKEGEWQPIMHI